MAGFIITSGSNFTPFSYEELIKPVQQYTDAQNAASATYSDLLADSSALKNYIDEQRDAEASRLYEGYMNKLQTLYDNLWNKGYSSSTARDIATARAGFTGDITRLAKAIETRQQRSKEYWDSVHKNRDLVTGRDPGLSSLDDYLSDANYGQNWFSYSGTALAKEVAADVAAKTADILRNPELLPGVAGYITLKRQQGITNSELQNAGKAARAYLDGNSSALDTLDPYSRIVADSIVTRMNSTGASYGKDGNLDKDSYDKLFGYAMMGAATGGIREPSVKDYEDKNWEMQKQLALENARFNNQVRLAELKNPSDGASGTIGADSGKKYTFDSVLQTLYSQRANEASADIYDKFEGNFNRDGNGNVIPMNVVLPDGRTVPVYSTEELSSLRFDTPERKLLMDKLGIDIELGSQDGMGTTESRQSFTKTINGKQVLFNTGNLDRGLAKDLGITARNPIAIRRVVNGKPVLESTLTKEVNALLEKHQEYKTQFDKMNKKSFKANKVTIDSSEARELTKKYGMDSAGLSLSDVKSAITTKEYISKRSPAVIAAAGESMKGLRNDYQMNILDSFRQGVAYSGTTSKDKKGKSQKDFAFYPIMKGGAGFADKGTTNLSDVFEVTNGKPKEHSIRSIEMYPQDIASGFVRITTDKGVFGVRPEMLQSLTADVIADPGFQNTMRILMTPFNNPDEILRTDRDTNYKLSAQMYELLGEFAPAMEDQSGNRSLITLKDIVRDDKLQSAYYRSILQYMNSVLSVPRDYKARLNYQERSNSSSEPATYTPFM